MPVTLTMTDRTLSEVQGALAEEREALAPMNEAEFRAFYDRTARQIRVYLARITSDPQLAEDLLQDTYYRFYRAGATHESESHRRNSLFRIATNLAHDAARRRGRGHLVPLGSDEDHAIAVDARTADRAESRTDLQRALTQLRPVQRQMLWLAYALGSSHEEIAQAVGVTAGSVKPLLFRARKKLAKLLRGEEKR